MNRDLKSSSAAIRCVCAIAAIAMTVATSNFIDYLAVRHVDSQAIAKAEQLLVAQAAKAAPAAQR